MKGHAAVQGLDGQAVEGTQHQVGPGKIAFPLAQKRQGPGQEPIYPGASQGDRRHLPVGEELLPVGDDAAAQGRHLDRGRGRFQPKEHCHMGGLVAGGGCQKKALPSAPRNRQQKDSSAKQENPRRTWQLPRGKATIKSAGGTLPPPRGWGWAWAGPKGRARRWAPGAAPPPRRAAGFPGRPPAGTRR